MENTVDNEIKGLTIEEVRQKVKEGKYNKINSKTSKTYLQIFFGNFFTWFNIICFVIAGVLIAIGSYENLLFLIIFLSNLLIGLLQEIKAKQMVDKISVMVEKKINVIRDCKKQEINIEDIVEGDTIVFSTGDQICCDCVILNGLVETNESLLTGESKPVKKTKGEQLFGGSFIVSGSCYAIATHVGQNCYSSKLVSKAKVLKKNKSDILKTLNLIIKTIGILLVPLGILTYFDLTSNQVEVNQALIKTSGSIIGMMPVGMFLLTSVSLVVGVIKLAKQKTLVQDLYSIEMLARANVLCLDKTGTLTDGTMKVVKVLAINEDTNNVKQIMRDYLGATTTTNQTNIALINFFGCKKVVIKKVLEFNSQKKYSAVTFSDNQTYLLGAPEFVVKRLNSELKNKIKELTTEGYRVVMLSLNQNPIKKDDVEIDSKPLAIIVLQDNIRKDAKETIEWFNKNDVQIKIISGDDVDTVASISKKVGINGYDKYISLLGKSDDEVMKLATEFNIFGRVSPEQKCLIIKALKQEGLKVAMTGDGVNDILALKESDCSIAMASGSEATRSASNLVMLENNFSSMEKIVKEGRRVINNISKASSLFLTKTFFTMFLTIFVLISPSFEYPLQPNQILVWESFFIGIPAFLLALQPNEERIKGSFIGSLTSKALPGSLILFLATMACYVYAIKIDNIEILPTLISYCITFGAFFILLNLCIPLDFFRTFTIFSLLSISLLVFYIMPNEFFNYATLSYNNVIFIIVNVFFIFILYTIFKSLFEIVFGIKNSKDKKTND